MPYNNVISRTDAQATIPEEVSKELRSKLPEDSAALSLFNKVPVGSSQVRFPVLSALPVAYWVTGDTGLKQTTEINWANKYLNIEELATVVPVPEAVLMDSDYDIWNEVEPLLRRAIARAFDASVFFGVNAPASFPPNVVASAVAAGNAVARGTSTTAQGGISGDISNLFGTVEADGYDANALVANRTYRGLLRNARNAGGDKHPEVDQTQAYGTDIGYPMRGQWPTGLSAAEAIAFDREEFVVGVRQDITLKRLDQAVIQDNTGAIIYNLAQQDMVAVRVVFRAGWQVANTINDDQPVEASRYPAGVLRSPAA